MFGAAKRVGKLLLSPGTEWPVIAASMPSVRSVLIWHLVPLSALMAVAWTIGTQRFPVASGPQVNAGATLATTFLLGMGSAFALGAAMSLLLPMYERPRQWTRALIVAAYGQTPLLFCGLLFLYPPLVIAIVVALPLALHVQFLGAVQVLGVARGNAVEFVVASALLSLGGSVAAGAVLSAADLI